MATCKDCLHYDVCDRYGRTVDFPVDDGVCLDFADRSRYVVREKGEWELRHIGHGHYWECSVCHTNPCIYVTKDTKFCPNCGADMTGGDRRV